MKYRIFKPRTKRFGPEEIFLVFALLLFIAVSLFVIYSPTFKDWSRKVWELSLSYSQSHGYLGGTVISFLAHTTVIIPVPYTILIAYLGSVGLNFWILGLLAGVGGGLGELTSYVTGLAGGAIVWKKYHSHFLALRRILESRPKILPWIIFLFGISPLPDDILMIPLGMVRYNFWKALFPMMIGKISLTTIIAAAGKEASPVFNSLLYEADVPWLSLITLASIIASVYVILKIDWEGMAWRLLGESNAPALDTQSKREYANTNEKTG